MANGVINLVLKSTSIGSGFDDVLKKNAELMAQTTDLSKAGKVIGSIFGPLGQIVGGGINAILKGGMWEVGAMALKGVITLWRRHKEAVENALEAERKAFDERVASVNRYTQAIKAANEENAKSKARIDALSAERDEIARTIKANNELERQRRLARGEDADEVNADIDSRNASGDRFEKSRKAAESQKKAEIDLATARKNAASSEEKVNELIKRRAELVSSIHARAQKVWADNNKFAANAGFTLKTSEEKNYMSGRGDKDYDERVKKLADINKQIADAKKDQTDAENVVTQAITKRAEALERVRAVEVENHAAAMKEANERAAAEAKAEDERLAAVAKNLEEARAAAEKSAQDAADREAEFQHRLQEEARQDQLKKDLENINNTHKAKMDALDKEIAKAKEEAAVWEQNAQRVRDFARNNGGGFAAWNAQQRDEARAAARGDAKQKNAVRVAEAEYQRLFDESMMRGDKMNPARRKRLAELGKFLELNLDPQKEARRVKALEEKREQLQAKMQRDIADIAAEIKGKIGL